MSRRIAIIGGGATTALLLAALAAVAVEHDIEVEVVKSDRNVVLVTDDLGGLLPDMGLFPCGVVLEGLDVPDGDPLLSVNYEPHLALVQGSSRTKSVRSGFTGTVHWTR